MHWFRPFAVACVSAGLLPAQAWACSLASSKEFEPAAGSWMRRDAPARLVVGEVRFEPAMGGEDSCAELGYIAIEVGLADAPRRRIREYGFAVRALSGVHDSGRIPGVALSPITHLSRKPFIMWHWGRVTPDADGHVRWRLEIVPLSRTGVAGEPVEICVATDDSCPARPSP